MDLITAFQYIKKFNTFWKSPTDGLFSFKKASF